MDLAIQADRSLDPQTLSDIQALAVGPPPVRRVWMVMRKPFQSIPVRGLFYFENGNPSGVFVKVGPTQFATPVVPKLNNPHLEYKCILNRGPGNINNNPGDFFWFTGNRQNVSRFRKVVEVNPSYVVMESSTHSW